MVEIGPGTGQATGRLLEAGSSVTAVELSPEMALQLRAKFGPRDLEIVVGASPGIFLAHSADLPHQRVAPVLEQGQKRLPFVSYQSWWL